MTTMNLPDPADDDNATPPTTTPPTEETTEAPAEETDEDFDRMMREAADAAQNSVDDDDLETDWSPDQGLHEPGWHRAVLANVDRGKTKAGALALDWAPTISSTGRTLKRKIPVEGGNGIERININFMRGLGVEPGTSPSGRRTIPLGQLKKLIGTEIEVKIEHRKHWAEEDRMVEDIVAMRLYQPGMDLGS